MKTASTRHPFTTDIDISSVAFWSLPFTEREKSFARLRRDAPVSWHPPVEVPYEHGEEGFWAVVLAADITEISKNSEQFCSGLGISLTPVPLELSKSMAFFLNMDGEEHSKFRQLVSAAFTPKQIKNIALQIQANAKDIVDGLVDAGEVDFVEECSALLPMRTIADMVGVAPEDKELFASAADAIVGISDPRFGDPSDPLANMIAARDVLHGMGAKLAADRRENPGTDLITNLVNAEIDGARLTDADIGSFMVLFAVAGNDTTKQTTTSAMMSLTAHPEQREWLMEDFEGRIMGAIEEFVRHATPVQQFTRTALQDIEFRGQRISAGDKVAIFYCSGNRDESVFEDPEVFDITRERSAHVGFGGGGAHFCLGNGVAKTQLKSLFGELLTRIPEIKFGEPEILFSNFINGYNKLPAYIPVHVK